MPKLIEMAVSIRLLSGEERDEAKETSVRLRWLSEVYEKMAKGNREIRQQDVNEIKILIAGLKKDWE